MAHFYRRSKEQFSGAGKQPTDRERETADFRRTPTPHRVRAERIRFAATFLIAVVVAVVVGVWDSWAVAPAAGWAVAAINYTVMVWFRIGRMDPEQTKAHAVVEDPSRATREALILCANIVSLAAVVMIIVEASHAESWQKFVYAAVALLAVASSWVLLHTMYTLRYAARYYSSDPPGGIYFNEDAPPCYVDFAYLAFTIGMSYAASDEAVITTDMRRVVLFHSIMSFVFGTGIVATTISLIVGLF